MAKKVRVTAATLVGWLAVLGLTACGGVAVNANGDPNGGGGNSNPPPPPPPTYTVGGTISGTANGLVLLMNGTSLAVAAGTNNFVFSAQLNAGATYAITVQTQPSGALCSVANGSGKIGSANVGNVVVTCSTQAYSLGGTISGLTANGLVLGNGSDRLNIASTGTSFTFPTLVAYSSSYSVKVITQPTGQACAVTNGGGTMGGAAVTNVTVTCTSPPIFTLSGSVSGLTASGLVLANSATHENLTVSSGSTGFTFAQKVAYGTQYVVTVAMQPAGLMCTVGSGSGTMPAANITNVSVTCSDNSYKLGGTIAGVSTTGLSLTDGTDTIAIGATGTSFTMPTAIAFGAPYSLTVATTPSGYTCSVSGNGTGTMPAQDVTSIIVTCSTASYTLGGQIHGLTVHGLILANGTDHLMVATNAATFTMNNGVPYGASYNVTVFQQPNYWTCTVTSGGSSIMPGSNVTNVVVDCAPNPWTWMGGSNTVGAGGGYPATVNNPGTPGARDNQMTWTDSNGHFWMFGGSLNGGADIDDVWTYDPTAATPAWIWVGGSNTQNAPISWGIQGQPSPANTPGARHGASTWVDSSGTLWLFGGIDYDGNPVDTIHWNDLWSYNTGTKQWTYVAGPIAVDDPGYCVSSTPPCSPTTAGVFDLHNRPSARANAMTWVDAQGRLWLFGGFDHFTFGGSPQPYHAYNDVWVFDPAYMGGQWAYITGSTSGNDPGSYTTAPLTPSARFSGQAWVDMSGKLWLFGGGTLDPTGTTPEGYNDLWRFDTGTMQWTWVDGTHNTPNSVGTYSGTVWPGARASAVVGTDSSGRVYLFGGLGWGDTSNGDLNDFWSFDPTTTQWTFINGSRSPNQAGVYGTLNTPDPANVPGGRAASAGWMDSTGHFWLFGGAGYDSAGTRGDLNDLWKY